ncbi:MAG: SGNH/GDSL hydrolase family protein [Elusimicrobiales bacterium]
MSNLNGRRGALYGAAFGLVLAWSLSGAAWAAQPGRIFTFGDSLSDPGNHHAAYNTVSTAPHELVPSAPYAVRGGFRFSNGPTWSEQFANLSGRRNDGRPALLKPGLFSNYAVGGARARNDGASVPGHNLGSQVEQFLKDFNGKASGADLYVVWCGSNDMRDALMAASAKNTRLALTTFMPDMLETAAPLSPEAAGPTSEEIVGETVKAVAGNIQALYQAGARRFLVPSVPNLALTPAVIMAGPAAQAGAGPLSAGYNGALAQALRQLGALPGIEIRTFDVNDLLNRVIADPAAFGFAVVDKPCVTPGAAQNEICSAPNRYLFWDGIHPTKAGHKVIARDILKKMF